MSIITDKINQKITRNTAVEDSLKQLQLQKDAQDSLMQQKALKDSANKVLADRLKTHTELEDAKNLDSQYTVEQPVSLIYNNPTYKNNSEKAIYELLNEMITHESSTNVQDDYKRFLVLKDELLTLHEPFQSTEQVQFEGVYGAGNRMATEYANIMGDENLLRMEHFFRGANSIDRAWPSNWKSSNAVPIPSFDVNAPDNRDIQSMVTAHLSDNPDNLTKNKHNFREATVARMVAQNQDVIDLILGTADFDESQNKVVISGGFVDLLKEFKLTGETANWEWMKESFGFRANAMKILDEALISKKKGNNYFFNLENNSDSFSKEMFSRVNAYPEAQQQIILETLQNTIDSIYKTGSKVEKEANVLLDEFDILNKKFPGRKGMSTYSMTPHTNKDLIKSNQLKSDLNSSLDVYDYLSGGENSFDVYEALNSISLEHLNVELSKLPDEEKTKALEEYLIQLTNSGGFEPSSY